MSDEAAAASAALRKAVDTYDQVGAADAVVAMGAALDHDHAGSLADEAEELMGLLRNKRWFGLMEGLGDALVRGGVDAPAVQRQYAQALLDGGRIAAGRAVLMPLLEDTQDDGAENAEVRGLLGRAYKQMYLDADAPAVERNREHLRTAAQHYYEAYGLDPKTNHWHGINTVALVARAARDRVPMAGFPDAASLATEILDNIEADEDAGMWEYGTAIEACVALGDPTGALDWTGRYLEHADAFAVAASLRQLEDAWDVRTDEEFGAVIGVLAAGMLNGKEGMQQTISAADKAALDAAVDSLDVGDELERILGTTGVLSLEWYRQGLKRSEGVALISDRSGRGVGTGFLVLGKELSPKLPAEEAFVLTNAHVVADDHVVRGTLFPEDALVSFEAVGSDTSREVELLWSSGPHDLDASLLRLSPGAPDDATPVPVAKRLPRPEDQRVYIIGHPLGGSLSFSLQDNLLLDVVEPKLHYRTPTEPGSSGSAVFNEVWNVVALHHAGSLDMERLRPVEGESNRYAANEGLAITAIKNRIDQEYEPPADG